MAVTHNYDPVSSIIAERVSRTAGRISAKRLLPVAVTAGYAGSGGTSAGRWPRPKPSGVVITIGGAAPESGRRATCRCSTGGRSGPCSCSVPCWPGADSASSSSLTNLGAETTMGALVLCMDTIRWRAQYFLLTRPHGLLEGRQRGGAQRFDAGLCPP